MGSAPGPACRKLCSRSCRAEAISTPNRCCWSSMPAWDWGFATVELWKWQGSTFLKRACQTASHWPWHPSAIAMVSWSTGKGTCWLLGAKVLRNWFTVGRSCIADSLISLRTGPLELTHYWAWPWSSRHFKIEHPKYGMIPQNAEDLGRQSSECSDSFPHFSMAMATRPCWPSAAWNWWKTWAPGCWSWRCWAYLRPWGRWRTGMGRRGPSGGHMGLYGAIWGLGALGMA